MGRNANDPFDIFIIGGGVNGCGIARDASGRGWSVYLCEQGDLASATSSASTKLIHGGLRYLEFFEFRLVREALLERETLLAIAPHIIWPLRFVLPHHRGLRPAWMLRLGLFLYDHLGGRKRLPGTKTLRLHADAAGGPLKPDYQLAFEYSDCWVEDSRLVVLNARDAADRGAVIATRTQCIEGRSAGGLWQMRVRNLNSGEVSTIAARTLVNAAGPWVDNVIDHILALKSEVSTRLVKGSHIVVEKLYPHDRCYTFQNADGRVFFAIPYEQDFTLIGTTDLDFSGDPASASASSDEISYLCRAASDYFRVPVTVDRVRRTYSGVRPLYDDGASKAQSATRDYVLKLEAEEGLPALLSVYGGKITTYRRLAEAALKLLKPHLPASEASQGWTASAPLPGGDFDVDGFDAQVAALSAQYPFLPGALAKRLTRAYGTIARKILKEAKSMGDLGTDFGAGLTEAEINYLMTAEWAQQAEDIIWRRSKLGLHLTPDESASVDRYVKMARAAKQAAQ